MTDINNPGVVQAVVSTKYKYDVDLKFPTKEEANEAANNTEQGYIWRIEITEN